MNDSLTPAQLEEKIKRVEIDLKQQTLDEGRVALQMYLDFLKEELKEARAKKA
jgi:hypothetical protein